MIKKGYFLFLTGASSWRFSGLGLLPCSRSMKLFMSDSEGASLHFFMSSLFMTFSSWCGLRDRRAESTRLWSSSGSFSVSEDSWTKLTYAARVLPRPSSKSWRRHLTRSDRGGADRAPSGMTCWHANRSGWRCPSRRRSRQHRLHCGV